MISPAARYLCSCSGQCQARCHLMSRRGMAGCSSISRGGGDCTSCNGEIPNSTSRTSKGRDTESS